VPHFTSPIASAAVGHCLLNFPGSVMNEAYKTALPDYLKEGAEFRDGRMTVSSRPGLGVVFDERRANLLAEFTEARPAELYQGESIHRPDGSHLYL
jgi:galactonate dehydratase